MNSTLKVVIPMAGLGTRLRPHTWSKPKQLVSVAGKSVLDHVLGILDTLPETLEIELINIIGYRGEQIKEHVQRHFPQYRSRFVIQEDPKGQSHAIQMAEEYLDGPMMVIFADTLTNTDLSHLETEEADALAWVKKVPDPRRFGVAELNQNGFVSHLVEKPENPTTDLAVVGLYYFKDSKALLSAINEQLNQEIKKKNEYFLVDAINIMLERGLKMRSVEVDLWLDAGTPESLLETNRVLLESGFDNNDVSANRDGVVIVPPVYIHPTAEISQSIIGPHSSIGAGCIVTNSIIRGSILENYSSTKNVILENSLIGRKAVLSRRAGTVNAGDNAIVIL